MSDFQQMIAELADKVAAKTAIKTAERILAERPTLQRYLSTREASIYLGFSTDALQLWRGQLKGPKFLRVIRSIKYDVKDLDGWMTSQVPGIDGVFVTSTSSDGDSDGKGVKV